MKILQVSHRMPWPLNEGGTIGIYNYTRGYAEAGAEITLLALDAKKHKTPLQEAKAELEKYARVEVFPINTDLSAIKAFFNLFSRKSYNVIRFESGAFRERLRSLLKEEFFDVIQVEGTFAALYSDTILECRNPKSLLVMRQHNVEFQIWDRLAGNTENILKRWYLKLLAKRLKNFEKSTCLGYDLLVPVTEDDGRLFKLIGCDINIFPSPAGIDTSLWHPAPSLDIHKLYHLGSLEWLPNQEAVLWFLNEIWPAAKNEFPELKFYLAGKNMPESFRSLRIQGVEIISYVPDAPEFIEDKGINIVPLRSGSGIRLKILEAMSAGKIVITTGIGVQGIEGENGKHFLIAEDANSFVHALKQIHSNPELAKSISENARNLIVQKYSNSFVIKSLIDKMNEIISQKRIIR